MTEEQKMVLGINALTRKPAQRTGKSGYGEVATEVQGGRLIHRYSHETFVTDVVMLARQIALVGTESADDEQDSFKPDVVIGIARGGLPVATYLAHALHVRSVTDVDVLLGDVIPPKYHPRTYGKRHHYLLVDDMSDSGHTFMVAKEALETTMKARGWNFQITTAALWVREGSSFVPDYYARQVIGDAWIDFPWEADVRCRQMGHVIELMGFDRKFFDPPKYLSILPMTDAAVEGGVLPEIRVVNDPDRASVFEDSGEAHLVLEELVRDDHEGITGVGVPSVTTVAYDTDRHAKYWRTFKV